MMQKIGGNELTAMKSLVKLESYLNYYKDN